MSKITDYNDGDLFNETLMVVTSKLHTTSTNSSYIKLLLNSIENNKIEAIKWQTSSTEGFEPGAVINVKGKVQEYKGQKSVIANEIGEPKLDSNLFPELPISGSPLSEKDARDEFKQYFQSIKSKNLREVIQFVIEGTLGEYFKSPAAKNIHHAFEGGLVYHSLTMAKIADLLASVYPHLNRDLLIAAALLHDAGKTSELVNGDYSAEGHLFGHIIIVNDLIQKAIFVNPELAKDNDIALLKHIILAHHGKLEWGSPVLGSTPEAILFHHIDKIDADMMIAKTELNTINEGEFTGRVWPLDSRYLFKPGETQILSQ